MTAQPRLTDSTPGDSVTVEVTNINAVMTDRGLLVEFEYTVKARGFADEWGAAQRLLPWPLDRIPE